MSTLVLLVVSSAETEFSTNIAAIRYHHRRIREEASSFPPSTKMQIKGMNRLELPPTADMHVHLRQAGLMEVVVPTVRKGGVDTVFV